MTKMKFKNYKSTFIKLDEIRNSSDKEKYFFYSNRYYYKSIKELREIPKTPLAYWISDVLLESFKSGKNIGTTILDMISGNKTANNDKYIRFNWEVDSEKINNKWYLYAKGGQYRKWYGNIDTIIDWSNEARSFYKNNKTSNLINAKYWFKSGISYTDLTSKSFNGRLLDNRMLFDMSGPALLIEDDKLRTYVMALLNSCVGSNILSMLNSSFHVKLNDIARVPYKEVDEKKENTINK